MSADSSTQSAAEPHRRRRFRRQDDRPDLASDDATALVALHAELVLLREENARLKAAEHEAPGLGPLLHRSRSASASMITLEDLGDDAAQVLAEALVLRESLLGACQEIIRSLQTVETRLQALAPQPA